MLNLDGLLDGASFIERLAVSSRVDWMTLKSTSKSLILGFRLYVTPTGTQKSCNARFKSPVLPRGACQDTNKETLQHEIEELKHKNIALDQEIAQLLAEGYNVEELDGHIALLHEYNEMKDIGQMLLGQMALIRGVTTKELYPEFDLDLND
ncbi:hypothetical protein EYD10_12428 [Varanus komodoensis]|nr:hypothetical protein EYD10_12428 [Varanus komodoensis]